MQFIDHRTDYAMGNDEMYYYAPSIFATEAHCSRKERYGYIPTSTILDNMRNEGYQVRSVSQQRSRDVSRREHTRHMVRLWHPDMPSDNGGQHEIILLNSHDGTSSFRLASGFFRFVCCNGLWLGKKEMDIKLYHRGANLANEVIEGSFKIIKQARTIAQDIQELEHKEMATDRRIAFANQALRIRFGDRSPISAEQALKYHRSEDSTNTFWNIFNRVQENVLNGGMWGRSANGKQRKIRAISGMDKAANFNSRLWDALQVVNTHDDPNTLSEALIAT